MMKLGCFTLVIQIACRAATAQVVLTEVMFDPLESDSHYEFVEVVNLSPVDTVDLAGWQISDGTDSDFIVSHGSGTALPPGRTCLILDPSYYDNPAIYAEIIPPTCLVTVIDNSTFGSRGWSNSSAETVTLSDDSGRVIAAYTYTLDNDPGYSDEKVDLSGGDEPGNWLNSLVLSGTPGDKNSVAPRESDLALVDLRVITAAGANPLRLIARIFNAGRRQEHAFMVHFYKSAGFADLRDIELLPPRSFSGHLEP